MKATDDLLKKLSDDFEMACNRMSLPMEMLSSGVYASEKTNLAHSMFASGAISTLRSIPESRPLKGEDAS